MDSINKNQPEENRKNLNDAEAIKKIQELGKDGSCFFCTNITSGQAFATRPMSVQKIDDRGNLWFLSASDSHKNKELENDPGVQLLFKGQSHSEFLNLYGNGEVSRDRDKIDELWEPILKTWFTEGKDDPRITVIKVAPSEGYYWDNKHGQMIAFAKMAVGAAIGKTLDDSIEGDLNL